MTIHQTQTTTQKILAKEAQTKSKKYLLMKCNDDGAGIIRINGEA